MFVQQLAEVAKASVGESAAPPMENLLACVKNIRQVALLLQQPGRRFKGPAGPEAAAVCIQAHWRYDKPTAMLPGMLLFPINQLINQSINHSINQSTNQSTNQPINQLINQSI